MGKEYTHRHGRRKKRKKSKAKKKKTGRRKARSPHKAPRPGFRKRRRYAARPQRAPAQVLQERTTQAMMIELARQLLGPRYPGPNKITQPFLPYDPWARQRHGIQREEEQRLEQMARIARERAQRQADDGGYGVGDNL